MWGTAIPTAARLLSAACQHPRIRPVFFAQPLDSTAKFRENERVNPAVWHIITWKDYIEGPFDTYEAALAEAMELGRENRTKPQVKRLSRDFYQYRAPYDKQEKWWPTFCICTEEAARNRGIPIDRFIAQYTEAA